MNIRKLESHADYLQAEDLQRKVWAYPDREVIPLSELVTVQRNGGHVFAAFEGDRMVAFCWGLPGYRDGRAYHCSRMLGVVPELRDSGLGRALKLEQRRLCLEQGLDLIRWTFDPLQSRNAYFNIEKLGVIVREYHVNLYGESGSQFNVGWETDRLGAEWWIRSPRVAERLEGRGTPPTLAQALALPRAGASTEGRTALEIPSDINAIKRDDLAAAREWRGSVRAALVESFRRGYAVTGFATGREGERRRSFYILEKDVRAP